jgi:hypothetical protein
MLIVSAGIQTLEDYRAWCCSSETASDFADGVLRFTK